MKSAKLESSTVPDQVIEVLKDQDIGYLSVLSKKGELYSYPVAFHYSGLKIYLMTPVSAAKFKFIKTNPAVSFIVDNRKVTTECCGALFQGKAKIFTVSRMFLSILSVGPKMVGFARKYPGMLTFYTRGKGLPDERKLYKYRIIRIDPTKIIYWIGYTFARYVPKPTANSEGDSLELSGDEEGIKVAAKLLRSVDVDLPGEPMVADHDWLARLDATTSAGVLSGEERRIIRLYKSGLFSRDSKTGANAKVTQEEKKLLMKARKDSRSTIGG